MLKSMSIRDIKLPVSYEALLLLTIIGIPLIVLVGIICFLGALIWLYIN